MVPREGAFDLAWGDPGRIPEDLEADLDGSQ